MFNFHKPRTYRSAEGCCICKAKSSSSRFADSRKYEKDTIQCFDLKYPRQGEICNACVLLIKRFNRLPVGSKRNWSHIVDAKAGIGPGYNKIQTKSKSERINSKAASQQHQSHVSSSPSPNYSNNNGGSSSGSSLLNGMCFIPERFSKIFKKSKKLKDTMSHSSKRKSSNNGWSQNSTHSLPTTPDSMDSDYEDARINASISNNPGSSTVVQFQTQTRASAYKAQAAAEAKKKIIKLGTKRRKCLPPRKNSCSTIYEESLQFFNEEEWCERKSCCGMFYECASLAGALLIDIANYKPCEKHQRRIPTCQEEAKQEVVLANVINNDNKNSTLPFTKSIIQTMPAMVQLHPPQVPPSSASVPSTIHSMSCNSTNNSFKMSTTTSATPIPTPVLKKHHLFYKRQSECFPQGDMVTTTNSYNNAYSIPNYDAKIIKTESEHHHNQSSHNQQHQQNSTTLQKHIENAIHSNSSINPPTTILTNALPSLPLSISVTSSATAATSSSVTNSAMPQMPKHSLAKVTTISPPLTTPINHTHHHYNPSINSGLSLAKPNSFLHKLKTDSGKIVKHSLEKFNSAVKLKTSDINDMKPIIRTVDKSYILAKPPTQANIVSLNATTTSTSSYQSLASYNVAAQPPLTTASLSAASPTSSTSSTSSTKFSDNSSDSGFDENMLDRKSASPLQEDCEKKILSRPGVQTMFLASGVQIQGQPQNLMLNGNEVAAKILQNRKYNTITANPITTNPRSLTSNHHPATTAVKIAQIATTPLITTSAASSVCPPISMSSAAQAKMRAIYNNNNTIQHENGITTIVPASSLAASTQTAAMQNIAPSTVTITPAPPMGTQFNTQNVISRKLTTANIINLQSNTTNFGNPHNNTSGNHHPHLSNSSSNNNNHNNTTNQKIILLKTSPNNTPTVTSANYNNLTGGGGQFGSSGGGR